MVVVASHVCVLQKPRISYVSEVVEADAECFCTLQFGVCPLRSYCELRQANVCTRTRTCNIYTSALNSMKPNNNDENHISIYLYVRPTQNSVCSRKHTQTAQTQSRVRANCGGLSTHCANAHERHKMCTYILMQCVSPRSKWASKRIECEQAVCVWNALSAMCVSLYT